MAGGALLYVVTSVVGVEAYKFYLPGGLNAAYAVEIVIYLGTFLLTIPVSLWNIYLSYKDGTGKMRPFLEAMRPLIALVAQALLCWMWALASKNDIINADPRCFFYMSGTLYSNIVARLIVSQMSGTRCESLSPGLVPLTAAVIMALVIPGLPKIGELAILYLLTAVLTISHLHYAVCVLIQMCQHLNITLFKIKPKPEGGMSLNGVTRNRNEDTDRLLSNQEDLAYLSSDSDEISHYNEGISSLPNLEAVKVISTEDGQSRFINSTSNPNC